MAEFNPISNEEFDRARAAVLRDFGGTSLAEVEKQFGRWFSSFHRDEAAFREAEEKRDALKAWQIAKVESDHTERVRMTAPNLKTLGIETPLLEGYLYEVEPLAARFAEILANPPKDLLEQQK